MATPVSLGNDNRDAAGDFTVKVEQSLRAASRPQVTAPALAETQSPTPNISSVPDVPPEAFLAANRIHIQDGSFFIDPYLVLHRRELAPENEPALREKLKLTYSLNSPSFFEDKKRREVALNLGELVPVSLEAKRAKLETDIENFNREVETGRDEKLTKSVADHRAPMRAIVRDVTGEESAADPVGVEQLKNGLAIYLLCRERLSRNGYLELLTNYVEHRDTPEQVTQELADKIGITPRQMREAAYAGGVAGVAKLLQLEPEFTTEVSQFVEYLSGRDFSMNDIEHWHAGRQVAPQAGFMDKIRAGYGERVEKSIHDFRAKAHGIYESPEAVQREEQRVAGYLSLVEPIERALLFALGYEICHTPENTADKISGHKGVYGLHRKTADDLRDVRGTYRVYFGGKGNEKDSLRTLRHEIAHNLWPAEMTAQEIATIDALAESDRARYDVLKQLTTTDKPQLEALIARYQQADAATKSQLQADANAQFAGLGDILPALRGADQLAWMVSEVQDRLSVEGKLYNRTGYDEPATRFREVISRYSELQYVAYREQPEMQALLGFVAPGLTHIFRDVYLPHLERVYQKVVGQDLQVAGARSDADIAPTPPEKPYIPPQPQDAMPKVDERPRGTHPENCQDVCCKPVHAPSSKSLRDVSSLARFSPAVSALKAMGVDTDAIEDVAMAR